MNVVAIKASAYLKQGRYREAERLFMEVLNNAHENEPSNSEGDN